MPPKTNPKAAENPAASKTPPPASQQPASTKNLNKSQELNMSQENHMDRSDVEDGLDDVPTDNIRQYILKHYGIDAEQEKKKKELKAEKFRMYVQNTGLQIAFQLVISEFLSKNIPKEEAFKFAAKRFKEIGKEYDDIKKAIEDKKAKEQLKLVKAKPGDDKGKAVEKSPEPQKSAKSVPKKK